MSKNRSRAEVNLIAKWEKKRMEVKEEEEEEEEAEEAEEEMRRRRKRQARVNEEWRVDQRGDDVDPVVVHEDRVGREGLHDRRGVGETRRLEEHGVELLPPLLELDELAQLLRSHPFFSEERASSPCSCVGQTGLRPTVSDTRHCMPTHPPVRK